MTVKQLREKLSDLGGETRVVVYAEDQPGRPLFEIDDVSIGKGTPTKLGDGKAAFKFGEDGPASWLFITVSAA